MEIHMKSKVKTAPNKTRGRLIGGMFFYESTPKWRNPTRSYFAFKPQPCNGTKLVESTPVRCSTTLKPSYRAVCEMLNELITEARQEGVK